MMNKNVGELPSMKKGFSCPSCGKSFPLQMYLARHQTRMHSGMILNFIYIIESFFSKKIILNI